MKIKTKIPVTYNYGIVAQTQGIVEGTLMLCNQRIDTSNFNFLFEYKKESGELIKSGAFEIQEPEITALYEAVKNSIPSGLSYTEQTQMLYYLGFRIQMAQTFGVELTAIDLITE